MIAFKNLHQTTTVMMNHQPNSALAITTRTALISAFAVIIITSAIFSSFSHAGNVYRWKDSNGTIHYGEHPPQGVNATQLNTTTGKSSKNKNAQRTRVEPGEYTGEEAAPETNEEPVVEQEVVKPKKDKAICERARYNLQVLTERARIRQTDENGEERYLTEEEKEEQKNAAESAVDVYCP